jgi:hypothetical protein
MLTREAAIQVVKNFVHDLESTGVGLQKAVLFGSYAQNRQSEWSDIDLALVSEGFSGFGFEDKQPFARIICKKQYSIIHIKTYQSDYFAAGDPFVDEIKRTGIVIFSKPQQRFLNKIAK